MKRIIPILTILFAAATISCTDFKEEEIPVSFGVDVSDLDFDSASSSRSVTVSSSRRWDIPSMPSWVSLGAISRSGRSPYEWIANFSAVGNDEYNREGIIVIKSGSDFAEISVTQDGKKGKYIAVESVSLSPTELTLTEGETASLKYTISPANASIQDVVWQSNAPSVATVTAYSGKIEAIAEGRAEISITTTDGNKTAICAVMVKAKVIPVTDISLDRTSLSLTEGETYSLVASVIPSNATDKSVTWSSSNTSVATVSSSGVVTAKSVGSASITVKTTDGSKTASCSVTVNEFGGLCLEAIESGTIKISNPLGLSIEYALKKGPWQRTSSTSINIPVSVGSIVCFRGDNDCYAVRGDFDYSTMEPRFDFLNIDCSGQCYVYGNIMSLISSHDFASNKTLTGPYTFHGLFMNNKGLVSHPSKDLQLPATSLVYDCYEYMFAGCYGLSRAPELPATKLEYACYSHMFQDCTSLISPPSLPAKVVSQWGYSHMFAGCTSLTTTPSFPATSVDYHSYDNMFWGCTSLKTVKSLSATSLSSYCYNEMFLGCTSITTAPELPATNLKESCYYGMFQGCSNLKTAPSLPATVLANNCYGAMFAGCISLTTAPELGASTLVQGCYTWMFSQCSKLNYIKCLAIDISADSCISSWAKGVASTGTFVKSKDCDAWTVGDSGIPQGWTITNDGQVSVTAVTLNTTTLAMTVGDTQTLTATVTPSNATNKSVTWASSNTSVATVSSSGVVTAKAAGSATITVTTNDGGKKATCSVTVNPQTVSVTSVSLNCVELYLNVGSNYPLVATVTPSNATDKSVTWSSSNTSVATVSSSGVVTAKAAGSATITVTTNDGGMKATCSVTVQTQSVSVTGVSLNKTSLSMTVGDTQTLTATVTPSNATDKSVTWSSSNTSVATVSSAGVVTAKAAGSATITVTTNDGGKKATCSVTVQAQTVAVTGVSLNKTSLSMTVGDTQTLTATVSPSNATDKSVTWSSSNTSVATVSSAGVVTAKAVGTATITVTTNDGGKKATCTISVSSASSTEPDAVDLGLSVKWASFNIGAEKPEDYGDYFAWGETETKSNYSWSTYKYGTKVSGPFFKYNTNSTYGTVDNNTVLDTGPNGDDVASKTLCGKWRIPTDDEWTELRNNCIWRWTTQNGIDGYKVESTNGNGNSIFLPAAGYRSDTSLKNAGTEGTYWSSSLNTDSPWGAWYSYFKSSYVGRYSSYRCVGRTVRPVTE